MKKVLTNFKKLTATFVALALVTALFSGTVLAASEYQTNLKLTTYRGNGQASITLMKGDLNDDGKINSADETLMSSLMANNLEKTPELMARADFNNDGEVDILDLAELRGIIEGSKTTSQIYNVKSVPGEDTAVYMAVYTDTNNYEHIIKLPANAGESTETNIDGIVVKAVLNADNSVEITGIPCGVSGTEQKIAFEYMQEYYKNLNVKTDKNGAAEITFMKADMNNDDKVNASDVNIIVEMITGAKESDLEKGDITNDGAIDSNDFARLLGLLNGSTIPMYTVVDTPGAEYKVSSITYEGSSLTLPEKAGESTKTTVGTDVVTVSLNKNGTVEVSGLSSGVSRTEQEIVFTHAKTESDKEPSVDDKDQSENNNNNNNNDEQDSTQKDSTPKTGDSNMIWLYAVLAIGSMSTALILIKKRKSFNK